MEINHKVIYNDLIKIYNINLSYFKNLDYNKIEKNSLLRDLALFVINDKKFLNELYKGDKDIFMFKNELSGLTNQFDEMFYCSDDELQRQINLEMKEEGFKLGIEEGAKEANIEAAKKLLEKGFSIIRKRFLY